MNKNLRAAALVAILAILKQAQASNWKHGISENDIRSAAFKWGRPYQGDYGDAIDVQLMGADFELTFAVEVYEEDGIIKARVCIMEIVSKGTSLRQEPFSWHFTNIRKQDVEAEGRRRVAPSSSTYHFFSIGMNRVVLRETGARHVIFFEGSMKVHDVDALIEEAKRRRAFYVSSHGGQNVFLVQRSGEEYENQVNEATLRQMLVQQQVAA